MRSVLGFDDSEATRLAHHRLRLMSDELRCPKGLLEIEEAIEVLDRNDHYVVKDQQKAASSKEAEMEEYARVYSADALLRYP